MPAPVMGLPCCSRAYTGISARIRGASPSSYFDLLSTTPHPRPAEEETKTEPRRKQILAAQPYESLVTRQWQPMSQLAETLLTAPYTRNKSSQCLVRYRRDSRAPRHALR